MKKIILFLHVALLVAHVDAPAQQRERLVAGRTIERTLASGQTHSFSVSLQTGRFVVGRAMQQGIDLQVILIGPAGDTLGKFDSPNGASGPEPFSLTTETSGEYTVVVAPLHSGAAAGRYTLTLERVVAAATTPGGKVEQMMAVVGSSEPGVVAAVVRDGKIVYQNGWGSANLTHGIPFTISTPTNIGSTSKHFTAFAILMLAQQNKLTLDDDIRKHIPELPDLGQVVTIRHLLTHTSGYREFLNSLALAGRRIDFGDYIDRDEVIALLQRQPALQNAPGAEFNYNNSGYSLLSTVVERIGGTPFPQWMADNVFVPLGMKNTVIRAMPGQIIPHSAQGYVTIPGGFREAQDIGGSLGAGGIYTTLGDLAKWMGNFKTGDVGAPGFFQQMITRNILTSGDTSDYGLGMFVRQWRGLKRVDHGGADIAHRSAFHYFPEIDAGVIVQSNNASAKVEQYAERIAEMFFEDRLDKVPAVPPVASTFDVARFDTLTFLPYAGRYELQAAPGFIISFSQRGGRFYTQATGQPELEIIPTSDSTFKLVSVNASVTFHREADGQVNRITLNQNGAHTATRIGGQASAAKPVLSDFTGRYFSEELEVFYDIAVVNDTLTLNTVRGISIPLKHQRGDTFGGSFPIATITFDRDSSGSVVGLRAGNGRTRDVAFKKQN